MIATAPHPPSAIPRWFLAAVLGTVAGVILLSAHATDRHGAEANAIRRCLERKGPAQVWQKLDVPDVFVFCVEMDPPGCNKVGILIAQLWPSRRQRCDYRERTAFTPRDGSPEQVEDYLQRFARRVE